MLTHRPFLRPLTESLPYNGCIMGFSLIQLRQYHVDIKFLGFNTLVPRPVWGTDQLRRSDTLSIFPHISLISGPIDSKPSANERYAFKFHLK
jgi:hypothetical protein